MLINKDAEFQSNMLDNKDFDFRILIRGTCTKQEIKKIQSLFNKYLKLIEAAEINKQLGAKE